LDLYLEMVKLDSIHFLIAKLSLTVATQRLFAVPPFFRSV